MQDSKQANPALAIDVSDLRFSYSGKAADTVLHIPHWQVETGQHVFLYGSSGSGKSTLLNLLAGTLTPDSGEVKVLGESLGQLGNRRRDAFRARHIGMIFQQFNLLPYMCVEDNIRLAAHFSREKNSGIDQRIVQLFERLQLDTVLLSRRADTLSVGQQQRVAIARALINRPELVIADEPSSALDTAARDSFIHLLLDTVASQQGTLLLVSHDSSLSGYFSHHSNLDDLKQQEADLPC